jgi:2-polyprenyl-6-methoxyphenol hydroxylase-like FAD-dependent oxidoreductase
MQNNDPQKILIVGAGFAGLSAAYWLGQHGHRVVVIERSPTLRDSGAQVDLRTHGVEIVERMGLLDAVKERQVHEVGFEMIDSTGAVKSRMLANTSGRGAESMTAEYEIMRGDMLRLLYDSAREHAEFRFDTMIEHFDQDAENVTVHFADGSSETFDLLIAADGQGSRIRKAILPTGADPYRRAGVHVAYWILPRDASDSDFAKMYNAPEGRLIIRRSHSDSETQIYFFLRDPSPEARAIHRKPIDEQKRFWAEKLAGAGWQTPRFLDALRSSDNFYSHEIAQIVSDTWHKGRVVLIGDAAHALPPMGWGVTSSLVGSYLLAHELERAPEDFSAAFDAYENAMRPFIVSIQPPSLRFFRILLPSSPTGIRMLHTIGRAARVIMLSISTIRARISAATRRGPRTGKWTLPEYDTPSSPPAPRQDTQDTPRRRG